MKTFKDLPDHSRIWIYQSPRVLTNTEVQTIKDLSVSFLKEWTSHKQAMDAAVEVFHERFVVVAVDEKTAPASGCGIDSSVKFIKTLSDHLKTDLLDRATVYYKENNQIESILLSQLATPVTVSGVELLKPETLVFNNLITTLGEQKSSWLVPASSSWHVKFIS